MKRPAPLDMRGIDPAAIYREVKPVATNAQQIQQPAAVRLPARSGFAAYSINAAMAEALAVKEAPPNGLGEMAGYSLNAHLTP